MSHPKTNTGWRHLLGPLGRYRPGWLRRDLAAGFRNCDRLSVPHWAHLPDACTSEERLLENLLLDGKVVYDIGAHAGAFSLFFSRRVGPQGAVIAFEPCPATFDRLRRNLEINAVTNVRPVPCALGREAAHRALYMLPGMPSTASLAPEARTRLRRRTAAVAVEPLDALARRLSLPGPDFIKIDVEGMEVEVLAGATGTLRRWRPDVLVEIHGVGAHGRRCQAERITRLLTRLGYGLTHVESRSDVAPGRASVAAVGHLFARCTPRLAHLPA
ncbi:MAG: FkbM family methyltransferase [Terriglobales bacterium]